MVLRPKALCHDDVDLDLGLLARLSQISLAKGEELPEWLMLVPSGDKIDALDGRKFSNSNPQAVVDAFNADPRDIPLDWEHATERIDDPDGPDTAPAAAWIDALEIRDGAIWGHIKEWTPRGAKSVQTKEYRYISPAFLFKKAGRVVAKIISAALVNRPALDMPALARSRSSRADRFAVWSTAYVNDLPDSAFLYVEPGGKKDADGRTVPRTLRHFPYKDVDGKVDLIHLRNALSRIPQSSLSDNLKRQLQAKAQRLLKNINKGTARENTMDRDKLIQLLGLAADASDDDIEAAIQAKAAAEQAAVEAKVEAERVAAEAKAKRKQAEDELANARAANPSLDKFVPRADYDAAVAKAKTLEAEAEQSARDAHAQAVAAAIDEALKAGKITPGTKDFYADGCATKEGLEKFKAFAEQAPPIVDPSNLDDQIPLTTNDKKITDAQRAIARQCGVSDEDFEKARAD